MAQQMGDTIGANWEHDEKIPSWLDDPFSKTFSRSEAGRKFHIVATCFDPGDQMKPPEAILRHKSTGSFLSGCGDVDPVAEDGPG